jgi:hypothetical protein
MTRGSLANRSRGPCRSGMRPKRSPHGRAQRQLGSTGTCARRDNRASAPPNGLLEWTEGDRFGGTLGLARPGKGGDRASRPRLRGVLAGVTIITDREDSGLQLRMKGNLLVGSTPEADEIHVFWRQGTKHRVSKMSRQQLYRRTFWFGSLLLVFGAVYVVVFHESEASRSTVIRGGAPGTAAEPGPRSSDRHVTGTGNPPHFLSNTGDLPRPTAFEVRLHRRITESYNAEQRLLPWAERMETTLRGRFAPNIPECLKGMELAEVECRESTCRIALRWPRALDDELHAKDAIHGRETAWSHLSREHGELGPSLETTHDRVMSDGYQTAEMVIALSGESIDPDKYMEWVERDRADRIKRIKTGAPSRLVLRKPPPGQKPQEILVPAPKLYHQ